MTTPSGKSSSSSSFVKVFLFTDLVGSTALKRRLGDIKGAEVIALHDSLFRECLPEFGGEEVDNAGDGFLALFDRPSDAVRCALAFQRRLAATPHGSEMKVRIGMNMGEAVRVGTDEGGGKYVGLAVDTAARVMSLAEGGQILLTRSAFDSARAQLLEAPDGSPLTWLAHGTYLCKGIDDPVEMCEVGIKDFSVLQAPKDSEKARRNVALDEEATLGWRPAPGQEIPHRKNWLLESKLGDGGFGEVWLASQKHTKLRRVFKFCFQTDRLRGLKREVALFRILKEALGDRNDIAQILDWQFEEPPFFLEAEYTEGGSFLDWAEEQGGVTKVPLETRIQIVIQTAEALAAAHSVGVLHKDIKPANILISKGLGGVPQVRLADFGIGLVTDSSMLKGHGFTGTELPSIAASEKSSTGSGTHMYMAPELFEGKRSTTLCDIYALGVLLYQCVSGDLRHAIAMGWERSIQDELLREDIAACVEGDPARRIQSAKELAELLRNRDARRLRKEQELRQREEAQRMQESEARARKTRRTAIASVGLLLIVLLLAIGFADMQRRQANQKEKLFKAAEQARQEADAARAIAEQRGAEFRRLLHVEQMNSAVEAWKDREFSRLEKVLLAQLPEAGGEDLRGFDWFHLWGDAHRDPLKPLFTIEDPELPGAIRVAFSPDGRTIAAANSVTNDPDQDGLIKLYDVASGEKIRTLAGHTGGITAIAFSPDGTRLATASQDKTARIWNPANGETVHVLEGHSSWVISAAYFPDGKHFVTGSGTLAMNRPTEIFVWDTDTGNLYQKFETGDDKGSVMSMTMSPDGARLFTGIQTIRGINVSESFVRIWDAKKGTETQLIPAPGAGMVAAVAPGWRSYAAGGSSKTLKLWEMEKGKKPIDLVCHSDWITAMDYSPDGNALVTGSGNPITGVGGGEIFFWNPTTQRQDFRPRVLDQGITSLKFSPSGEFLAAGSTRSRLNVWQWEPQSARDEVPPTPGHVLGLALAPDDQHLAVAYRNKGTSATLQVSIWNPQTRDYAATLNEFPTPLSSSTFSPDGNVLALSTGHIRELTRPGTVWLWKWKSADPPTAIETSKGGILSLAFSPDGRVLVGGGATDHLIHFWDSTAGAETGTLSGHEHPVQAVAFSPDGTMLATASFNYSFGLKVLNREKADLGELKVWDASKRTLLYSLESHQDGIQSIAFSPDGKLLATGGRDHYVRFWHAATGKPAGELVLRSARWVESMVFTEDGRTLIASGSRALRSQDGGELAFIDMNTFRAKVNFEISDSAILDIVYSAKGGYVAARLGNATLKSWFAPSAEEIKDQVTAAQAPTFNAPK